MNDRADMLQDIADVAAELCDARKHREPYTVWTPIRHRKTLHHETTRPGLIAELHALFEPGSTADERGARGYASRPPLNFEAAALYTVISGAVWRWVWSLKAELRDTVQGNVRLLVGAASQMDSDTQAALLSEMRSWQRRAAILTGWQSAPWRPSVPCPACAGMNTLVVNLADQSGFCNAWLPGEERNCDAYWNADTIGILADYVRSQSESKQSVTPAA